MVHRTAAQVAPTRLSAPGPAAEWVTRFVDEERQREQGRRSEERTAAARTHASREHLTDLMDSLRDRVARDVEAFDRQLPDRFVTLEDNPPGGGFIIRRGRYPEARLTVEPHPETGTFRIHYVFSSETGIVAPPMREVFVGGDSLRDLRFADTNEPVSWHSLSELSEDLLVPVFGGRPRP